MALENAQKINRTFAPINAKSILNRTRHRMSPKRIILLVGFITAVTVMGTMIVNTFTSTSEQSASSQVKSVFSGDEMKTYSSPENGFSIMMPGFPTISQSSNQSAGKEIPITTYERVIENRSKNYTVAVYDYSGLQLDEAKALESALNSSIQNTPNSQLVNTKVGKYGELNGIEATYNVSDKDKLYESHIRYVMKDSKMYSMILIGGDQAKFDEFANSLSIK